MLKIDPIPALTDNYIWLITETDSRKGLVVDPGEAKPVLVRLRDEEIELVGILLTHHHWDHINGAAELAKQFNAPIYAPAADKIEVCTNPLVDNDQLNWPELNIELTVLAIPGHTLGHVAYFGNNSLFCGDTLFAAGCGRLFEGTAQQMYASLTRLKNLPLTTEIYCGHEYTVKNLQFAHLVEPYNRDVMHRLQKTMALREQNLPTLPSTLAMEFKTNPFLRCDLLSVKEAVRVHFKEKELHSPVAVFAKLREWKDHF